MGKKTAPVRLTVEGVWEGKRFRHIVEGKLDTLSIDNDWADVEQDPFVVAGLVQPPLRSVTVSLTVTEPKSVRDQRSLDVERLHRALDHPSEGSRIACGCLALAEAYEVA